MIVRCSVSLILFFWSTKIICWIMPLHSLCLCLFTVFFTTHQNFSPLLRFFFSTSSPLRLLPHYFSPWKNHQQHFLFLHFPSGIFHFFIHFSFPHFPRILSYIHKQYKKIHSQIPQMYLIDTFFLYPIDTFLYTKKTKLVDE